MYVVLCCVVLCCTKSLDSNLPCVDNLDFLHNVSCLFTKFYEFNTNSNSDILRNKTYHLATTIATS